MIAPSFTFLLFSSCHIGIKTGAVQNMVVIGFIQEQFGVNISWGSWLLYSAPFSIIMSIALFFIMTALIKPETDKIEGGKEVIKQQLAEVDKLIPWGTIIVFTVGISLGTILLNTEGAQWLSDTVFGSIGLDSLPILATIALLTAFTILIHLGFASATSLASP